MYFDDLPVGFTFETGTRTLSRDEIMDFARQWDNQPFHTDPEAAAQTHFGGIVASGFHTLLIAFNLVLESGIWRDSSMGSPGMAEVRWIKPVRPGDTLRVRGEIIASRPSQSRPDRGRTEVDHKIFNQDDELVASFRSVGILKRKP